MKTTEAIATFINKTSFREIPHEVIDIAKEHVLDCIGVTIAGSAHSIGNIMSNFIREMGGEPRASVICAGFKTSAPHAAFANGVMAHALDYDDDYSNSTVVHATAVVLPAVLALGEENEVSGDKILEAYILGLEAEVLIGSIMNMEDVNRGWHATATLGALGAAAGCSKILGLNIEQTRIALGIAASSSCGLRQNFGTMTKPFHVGNAARSGVIAAMLAKRGFTAYGEILETPFGFFNLFCGKGKWEHNRGNISGLGNPFKIVSPGVYIKQYPSCAGTHSSIDAILFLINKYNVDAEMVDRVDCFVHPLNISMLTYSRPKTALEGKFSMEFCLGIALLDKKVGLEQFTDEKVLHPKTQELIKRVTMSIHPDMQGKTYKPGSLVSIRLKDGREYSHYVDVQEGSPTRRLPREKLINKYETCCKLVFHQGRIKQSIGILSNLEERRVITELLDLIRPVQN